MARDLFDLARRMDKKAAAIKAAASKSAVDAATAIVEDLAYATPVDTSEAVSNWVVTLGAPANQSISPHFPGMFGSTHAASANETIARAKVVLSKKKPGQTIFITNNAGHIRQLNDGSSTQAPAGFVERSVLIGRKAISKFKIKD